MKIMKTIVFSLGFIFLITVTSCGGGFGVGNLLATNGALDSALEVSDDGDSLLDDDASLDSETLATHTIDNASFGADEDDLLSDDDSSESLGSGWSNPEQLPVTLSKGDPDDEECYEDSQGDLLIVDPEDESVAVFNFLVKKAFAKTRGNGLRFGKTRSTLGRAVEYFEEKGEEPEVYQCQVSFDVDGEEVYTWVEIDYGEVLDLLDFHTEGYDPFHEDADDLTDSNAVEKEPLTNPNQEGLSSDKVPAKKGFVSTPLEDFENDFADNGFLQPKLRVETNRKTLEKVIVIPKKDAIHKMNVSLREFYQ